MRIGIDARMYGPRVSGIGNYVKNLIDSLLVIDKENEYVIFLFPENYETFHLPSARVKKVLVRTRWYSFAEQLYYWRKLEREHLDITHFPNFNVPLFYTDDYVVTIHDMTPWNSPYSEMKKARARRYVYKVVLLSGARRSRKIIAVSHYTKRQILEHFPYVSHKIQVIYPGIPYAFQKVTDYGIISRVREKFGMTKPYIFYIGVWKDHKNILGLLKAFEIIKKKYASDIQLVLGGERGVIGPAIQKTLDELSFKHDVIQTGFLSDLDLQTLYSAALVTVIPSFNEGFGFNGVESIMCETPVAASKTTSLPETLGESALYFDPKNPREMADTISRLVRDKKLCQELAQKGKNIIKRYEWGRCAKETLLLYKDALL